MRRHHRALAAQSLPGAWKAAFAERGVSPRSPLAILDAYRCADGAELVLRLEGAQLSVMADALLVAGGAGIRARATSIPRGSRLALGDAEGEVSLTWAGGTLTSPVAPDETALLAGRNALFAIASDPDPDVIGDWLRFHVAEQGADAAVVLVRGTDRGPPEDVPGIEDLIWLTCDEPLGAAGMPAEHVRHLAPDAPGKRKLDPAPADAMRAPLAEVAVMETIRRRFLARARGVLFCQPSDLVPCQGATVYERVAGGGEVLRFTGQRAYPAHLPDPARPRHHDHGAIAFDGSRAETIWAVAPDHQPDRAFWRQYRVATMDSRTPDAPLTYWRCMAIRHPGLKVSELVPRSSLVASDPLSDLVAARFGKRPAAPEVQTTRTAQNLSNDRIAIVTTMKNEGPFILDWLAFHRAIGVTDFLIYSNDCTDGTDTLLDLLARKGLVDHRANPFRQIGGKPQHAALRDAEQSQIAAQADWIIAMDVDEYIDVRVGDGTLAALFDAMGPATMMSLTWRLFGNGDVTGFEDRPVHEQFCLAAPEFCRKPHQAWGFKTMFRNLGHYRKFGVHRPKGLNPECLDDIRWLNGSGKPMPVSMYRTGWRSTTATYGYDMVSLNHYSLRSAESFLVKRDRGRVNHVDRDQGLSYWFRMNHNAVEERSILGKSALFGAERARLMADDEIAAAHDACVAAHRARIAQLKAKPEFANLFNEITGERLRNLSRVLEQFGTKVFLEGPSAVPADFLARADAEG